jgi:hypothetical protein
MGTCRLCKKTAKLEGSHIIPAFATRWLKKTGATSYLRTAEIPNKRVQDSRQIDLLCGSCEDRFQTYEDVFAKEIFHPYIEKELDKSGDQTGVIKQFEYKEWLLRFVISLQWRAIIGQEYTGAAAPDKYKATVSTFEETWRRFLLEERADTGTCESHVIFLQSLARAKVTGSPQLGKNAIFYMMRSVDATTLVGKKKLLGIYSKLGPIVFYTALIPPTLDKSPDTRVRMRGAIKPAQRLHNGRLNRFICITRPNEVFGNFEMSERQQEIVSRDMRKNLDRTTNSGTFRAFHDDQIMKDRRADS